MDLQYPIALRVWWVLVERVYGVYIDCASHGLSVCFKNQEPRLQFGISGVNCFLLMASQASKKWGEKECSLSLLHQRRKTRRKAERLPVERVRMAQRMKEGRSQIYGTQESNICDSINTADVREIVVTRVNETLTAYKNAQGEFDSPVIKQLVPALATSVAVAVSEAMKGVMRTMASHGHGTSARSTATENRLFAAVTSLTYENDRLQQYSRRESVRFFGIRQAEGETAEQVEHRR